MRSSTWSKGDLATERVKYLTPNPSTPEAVAEVVARLVKEAGWTGELGATFPAVIKNGVAKSAANVDKSWIGTDVDKVFTDITHCDVTVLNDADAAGIAEARFGAAKGVGGVVILLTFGTGIGSALLLDGQLVPNTELGHLELDGHDAEKKASSAAKDNEGLSLQAVGQAGPDVPAARGEAVHPRPVRASAAGSARTPRSGCRCWTCTPVKPAQLLNNAGIVGAAMAAHEKFTDGATRTLRRRRGADTLGRRGPFGSPFFGAGRMFPAQLGGPRRLCRAKLHWHGHGHGRPAPGGVDAQVGTTVTIRTTTARSPPNPCPPGQFPSCGLLAGRHPFVKGRSWQPIPAPTAPPPEGPTDPRPRGASRLPGTSPGIPARERHQPRLRGGRTAGLARQARACARSATRE